ncbi:Hypothetical protein PHPALM_9351 [Phytophthora palmivora]|uniref:Uncharacterized protein n=1 Tax=Phytophthora palmivora TaxID=4796 RepID=A0A2P4Y7I8_9STRA|nr:Hypothetical protein PHPALM_9351 [Phytophthora palmivora]
MDNEIPTVPIYCLANPQPRERAWNNQRGKKTLLSLTLNKREALPRERAWNNQRGKKTLLSLTLHLGGLAVAQF